jgi:PAS domain S-box-containing protein
MKTESEKTFPKLIGLLLVFGYIFAIAALFCLDIRVAFEPPLLLPVTNILFAAIIPLIVSFFTARAYLQYGSLSIFLMGCGMFCFGICAALAGLLIQAPHGANINVTIYNTGALMGSLFHVCGAFLSSLKRSPQWERGGEKSSIVLVYGSIVVLAILFTFATLQHVVPPFFIQGLGPTQLRQVVLGLAIFFYTLSAFFFMNNYLRKKSDFLYWYSLCLAMLALGLFAFYIQKVVGSPIGWAGRTSNYIGAVFALVAVWSAVRHGQAHGIALEEMVSGYFMDAEAGYRSLVETATDAIISYDQEQRIILWNAGAERIFGYTKAEAIGAPFYTMLVPEESVASVKTITSISELSPEEAAKFSNVIEIEAGKKDGGHLPVEIYAFTRKLATGLVSTCIIRDISYRKQAEEALRISEERYRRLFMDHHAAMILIDPQSGEILDANPSACSYYGYTHKEMTGMTIMNISTIAPGQVFQDMEKASSGERGYFYFRHRLANGDIRDVGVYSGPIQMDGKTILFSIIHDITDRKAAEQALKKTRDELEVRVKERTALLADTNKVLLAEIGKRRQIEEQLRKSEETYRLFFELSPAGVFRVMVDPATLKGTRIDCNDAHARILGYASREELLSADVADVFPSEDAWKIYILSIMEKKKLINYENQLVRKDGRRIWVVLNVSTRKMEGDDNKLLMEGTVVNVTDRKKAEEEMRAVHRKMRAMTSERVMTEERERQQIATVLHDTVAQTLAAAKMKFEFLSEHLSPDGLKLVAEARNLITQSIRQTRTIMAELSPPVLYEIGFVPALEWLAEQVQHQHGLFVHLDSEGSFQHLPRDLQVLLYQATRELLTNVVKHAKANKATVTLWGGDGKVRIEVGDDGVGLNKFNMGYHGDLSGGFGLFSIRERLRHFGGDLNIKSQAGKGTQVVMTVTGGEAKRRKKRKV